MKKNKFTEFFKGKGYYVLLFVGVIAIAAVALIGSQLSASDQKDQNQEYVDLNDTDSNIAAKNDSQVAESNPVSEGTANKASDSSADTAAKDDAAKDVAGNDVEYEDYSSNSGSTQQAAAKEDTKETTGNSVASDNTTALEALSFNTDDGLMWPVKGNVIMDYSMDHTTYFATLMQYKCNPAIILDAEVGTEVKASANGIVTDITQNDEETGCTLTMSIGDGYDLVYGQLNKDSVSLKVGDSVSKGAVIGTVAEPTKYYTVEGSNLFFEVTQNDKPVNPMLYIK